MSKASFSGIYLRGACQNPFHRKMELEKPKGCKRGAGAVSQAMRWQWAAGAGVVGRVARKKVRGFGVWLGGAPRKKGGSGGRYQAKLFINRAQDAKSAEPGKNRTSKQLRDKPR